MPLLITSGQRPPIPSRARLVLRALRYLAGKALTIGLTIFAGVFITVMLASQPSQRGLGPPVSPFQTSLETQIALAVRQQVKPGAITPTNPFGYPDPAEVKALTEQLRDEAGLNLPFLPRHLLWTKKALTFDWGLINLGFGVGRSGTAS